MWVHLFPDPGGVIWSKQLQMPQLQKKHLLAVLTLLPTAESTRRPNSIGNQTSLVPLLTKLLTSLSFLSCFLWFLSWSLIKVMLVPYPGFLPALPRTTTSNSPKAHTGENVHSDWCDLRRWLCKFYSRGSQPPAAWWLLRKGCGSAERYFQSSLWYNITSPCKVVGENRSVKISCLKLCVFWKSSK